MRTSRRSAVLLLALAAFLSLAASASAGMLSYDGATLVFTGGDNLDHEVQFRLSTDGANDEIIDTQPITDGPGDCFYVVDPTWVSCPGHARVRVDLGSGNDTVTTGGSQGDCFDVYTINLGDGTNDNDMASGCATPATATITAGSGQDTLRGGSASTNVTIFGGGGADTLNGGAGNDVVHGGEGNDQAVSGGAGNDQLLGEGGDDVIRGGEGNDIEDGGTGNDRVGYSPGVSNDDDTGADKLNGGPGDDRLLLDGHSGGMNITLDGVANDGSPGEGDNVGSDFEQIDGTNSADVFTGSGGHDQFSGGQGDDEIHGGGGDDDLYGGSGDDRVYGDAGNDKVQGANGSDIVDGGPGQDQMSGDIASCSFSCTFDPDQLFARDGEQDTVDCGGGADRAQVDSVDIVAFCASVDRSAPPAGGPGGPGARASSPLVVGASVKVKTLIKRGLVFRYKCAAACKVVATLTYKGKKLGVGRKTLRRAGTARVVVKIAKKSRAKVRRLKGKKLTLRVKVTSKRKTTTLTRKVKLKR
jgi:Ca2+-binding RTX toxin-like protein